MIGWQTHNSVSHTVMDAIAATGIPVRHISRFDDTPREPSVFYGLLRGCSRGMHILKHLRIDYWYIDNGYFDAEYIDRHKVKKMDGKYRVVKNGMHEKYTGPADITQRTINKILLIPPSPYSASFYDTTPEDWMATTAALIESYLPDATIKTRSKLAATNIDDDINAADAVIAFNSMAVLRAIELDKPVYDEFGILRNLHTLPHAAIYNIKDLRAFYEPKQFTLDEIREGKLQWK